MLNLFKRIFIRLQLLPGGIHWQQPTLHIVTANFDSQPLEKLLKAKPNLSQQNAKGQSALHIAIINKLPRNACLPTQKTKHYNSITQVAPIRSTR